MLYTIYLRKLSFVIGPVLFVVGWLFLALSPSMLSSKWVVAHGLLLLGTFFMFLAILELKFLLQHGLPPLLNDFFSVLTLLGLLLLAAQFALDIAAWTTSGSAADMGRFFDTLQHAAGTRIAFYTAGPGLFFVGLLFYGIALLKRLPQHRLAGLIIGLASPTIVVVHELHMNAWFSLASYGLLLVGFVRLDEGVQPIAHRSKSG